MAKPEQLSLIPLTKGRYRQPRPPVEVPQGRYRLIHVTCGYDAGYVKSLGYPLKDSRAGYEHPDGEPVNLRKVIRCPYCESPLTNVTDLRAVRVAS